MAGHMGYHHYHYEIGSRHRSADDIALPLVMKSKLFDAFISPPRRLSGAIAELIGSRKVRTPKPQMKSAGKLSLN